MILDRAADASDFEDVLACLRDEHEGNIPTRIDVISKAYIALCDLSQEDLSHWQMPFENIAKELEIGNIVRSTLQHIFHNHHDIFGRKAMHKAFLIAQQMEAWLVFAHMALHIAINHIVFTNEMWVEFNSACHAFNISWKCKLDSNEWAIHEKEVSTIWVRFWEAICMG